MQSGMTDKQFNSFLRELLDRQKDLEKAIDESNVEAKMLVRKIIDRLQKDLED